MARPRQTGREVRSLYSGGGGVKTAGWLGALDEEFWLPQFGEAV
jgi:hypothetical protein